MEFVRKYIDASSLMNIVNLPENLKNRKLEIIVLPADEQAGTKKNSSDVEMAIQSMIGAVPYTDMSLDELREERLQKQALENIL